MKRTIAEVVIHVGFEDGERAVFSVSPSGRLSPAVSGCADAAHWYEAAEALGKMGLGLPAHTDQARTSAGTCWPWADDE